MRKIWVVFIALIVVIGTAVIFGRYPFPVVQPPELGDGPITLRVVRAINDRFNSLTEEEFESVLDQTVRSVRYHFGLEVRFERGDDYTIAELFQLIPEPAEELALSLSYTPPLSGVSPEELISSIAIQIENGRVSTANILRFLEASIPGASRMGTKDLAESVAKIWLDGLRAWHGLVAKDGDRVIDSTNYHQYAM